MTTDPRGIWWFFAVTGVLFWLVLIGWFVWTILTYYEYTDDEVQG